jgi:hypothetical protein
MRSGAKGAPGEAAVDPGSAAATAAGPRSAPARSSGATSPPRHGHASASAPASKNVPSTHFVTAAMSHTPVVAVAVVAAPGGSPNAAANAIRQAPSLLSNRSRSSSSPRCSRVFTVRTGTPVSAAICTGERSRR